MTSICIVSQSHLCRNPRVLKEARALANGNYEVTILTAVYSQQLYQEDLDLISGTGILYQAYADLRRPSVKSFSDRLMSRSARFLKYFFRFDSVHALGCGAGRLKKYCLLEQADLYICHQELPACIGAELLKKGKNVAFDFEDWYSEDLLPDARKYRPLKLLKLAEAYALQNGTVCYTTSNALAKKLADAYLCPLPKVIYNVFPSQPIPVPKTFHRPLKLFWFSQTVGPGRGLEEFISLLNHVQNTVELHLLGDVDTVYQTALTTLMPAQHAIFFHRPVPGQELHKTISMYDIGLALEKTEPASRNYTITNKFFQYIQAGLPVIATETMGQAEAFEQFMPGLMLKQNAARQAADLNNWLGDMNALNTAARQAALAAAYYNWETEERKLLQLIDGAFGK